MDALDGRRIFNTGEKVTVELASKTGGDRPDRGERGDRGDRGDRRDRPDRPERGRGPSPSDKCFKCRGTGHW